MVGFIDDVIVFVVVFIVFVVVGNDVAVAENRNVIVGSVFAI